MVLGTLLLLPLFSGALCQYSGGYSSLNPSYGVPLNSSGFGGYSSSGGGGYQPSSSYGAAGSDLQAGVASLASAYHYNIIPGSSTTEEDSEESDDDSGTSTLALAAAGIKLVKKALKTKGLKKAIKVIKVIKGVKAIGKFLLPLLLAPILLPIFLIILLFLPIPVINPPTGRSSLNDKSIALILADKARGVLESEECIQRLNCELDGNKWIRMWLKKNFKKSFDSPQKILNNCSEFKCRNLDWIKSKLFLQNTKP